MPKITKVHEAKQWEGNHGPMYKSLIAFDSEQPGYVNMKSPDKWKVGDEVEITNREVNEKYGDNLKIGKPGGFTPNVGGKNDPEIQWKIDTSWAITSALTLLGDSAKPHFKDGGLKSTAKALLSLRQDLINELKSES